MPVTEDRTTHTKSEKPSTADDRRDSPRIPVKLGVRQLDAGGSYEDKDGDVGVGGAYFVDRHLPVGRRVQLRFSLPGRPQEIRCNGEILRISEEPGKFGAHVQFVDLPADAELAIAKFIDDREVRKDR